MNQTNETAARSVLANFEKDISRVEQLLRMIHSFRAFGGETIEMSGRAKDLWEVAQASRTDLPLLSGSLLMYICGRFEYFVRELVGVIVDDMVDRAVTYDELPLALRKQILARTLEINLNPSKFGHDSATASALAAQLADNISGRNDGRALFVEASTATITESNMRPEVLADLFRRVGIAGIWDTLGQQLSLRSFFDEATNDGCKKAAMARLEDVMSERNKVAHPTGGIDVFPDASAVEGIARYFKVLGQVLFQLAVAPRQA
jgi:hypothetical protein